MEQKSQLRGSRGCQVVQPSKRSAQSRCVAARASGLHGEPCTKQMRTGTCTSRIDGDGRPVEECRRIATHLAGGRGEGTPHKGRAKTEVTGKTRREAWLNTRKSGNEVDLSRPRRDGLFPCRESEPASAVTDAHAGAREQKPSRRPGSSARQLSKAHFRAVLAGDDIGGAQSCPPRPSSTAVGRARAPRNAPFRWGLSTSMRKPGAALALPVGEDTLITQRSAGRGAKPEPRRTSRETC